MWSGFFTGADDRLLSRPLVGGAEDGGAAKAADRVAPDWRKERRFMREEKDAERAEMEGKRSRWREDLGRRLAG
jgi:hypothetical protein